MKELMQILNAMSPDADDAQDTNDASTSHLRTLLTERKSHPLQLQERSKHGS